MTTNSYSLSQIGQTITVTPISFNDGTNTLTGSYGIFIGNNAASSDDSAVLVGRGLTGSYTSGAHAFRDESTYTSPSGTGLFGYSSFDSIATIGGSVHWNHAHSYQARLTYTGSGLNDEIYGFGMQLTHNGAGTVTNVYGLRMSDALGVGPITTQCALWVDPLTRGSANYAIYSGSTSVTSYHGGRFEYGTAPRFSASGFTSNYGQLLSVDASGNLLNNPNLTIISGVLSFKESTAKITSTLSNLNIDSTSQIVALKPIIFPVYTVATLPSASVAYQRVFVSDANATTFYSIVASGGSNKVPVFSDGTNWRIG